MFASFGTKSLELLLLFFFLQTLKIRAPLSCSAFPLGVCCWLQTESSCGFSKSGKRDHHSQEYWEGVTWFTKCKFLLSELSSAPLISLPLATCPLLFTDSNCSSVQWLEFSAPTSLMAAVLDYRPILRNQLLRSSLSLYWGLGVHHISKMYPGNKISAINQVIKPFLNLKLMK